MPRALACCPLYCGVQGRHQGQSLVVAASAASRPVLGPVGEAAAGEVVCRSACAGAAVALPVARAVVAPP